ncbi:DUF397 domain-containing protein [Streptomyces sp. NPDC006923]|uniref:DUF397 domain-containing protein n=1 Tax=Streptomyces sp. NPDC006923 TaxID=3155355 RepID=UPI0034090C8E
MTIESAAWVRPELEWTKSSYSGNEHGSDCVEMAATPEAIHVRDSKKTDLSPLTFPANAWTRFVAYTTAH